MALLSSPLRIASTVELCTWLLVAIGIILRLLEYTDNRPLYMDEFYLLRSLVRLPVFDFSTTLADNQLATPGFLVVERAMLRSPLPAVWAARLVPLLCSIASMFLIRSVARRYIAPPAVPIAVGLFALDYWLLYYAAEIKQYTSDVALTLCALALAAAPTEMSRRRLLVLAGFGVVGVWFSHPLSLVLAGVGTYLIAKAAIRREWSKASGFLCISLAWALSFGACYHVSHSILEKEDPFIWSWWNFAFLPLPPHSLADLQRDFWHVINIFNSPSWVITPLGVLPSAFCALTLFSIGVLSLGLKWRGGAYLLLAPLLFALLASALRQYPFHGRLLLFLVPTVHLLVGEGAAAVARGAGAALTVALGTLRRDLVPIVAPSSRAILTFALCAFLLAQPAGGVFWHRVIQRHSHGEYDSHGDLVPDLLDYLEKLERDARPTRSPP
jgi:hypothetical protein